MLNNFKQSYNNLCSPAQAYLVITSIWLIITFLLNQFREENTMCTLVYSFIWVFILNLLCKKSEKLAWAVFLLPIFFHILILLFFICFLGQMTAEIVVDEEIEQYN